MLLPHEQTKSNRENRENPGMSKDSRGRFAASKNRITVLAEVRDAPAARMFDRLSHTGGKHVSDGEALTLVSQANALSKYVKWLADQSGAK
jgi:hypothetical protein